MPRYTMRLTWPDDPDCTNDFVFCVDGKPAGRCYFMRASNVLGDMWRWTIYGTALGDLEKTLADAQAAFKTAFEDSRKASQRR